MSAPRRLLTDARRQRATRRGVVPHTWTNPQRSLFASPFALTVFWGANGIGKSVALAEYTRRAIAGELPWQVSRQRTVILTGRTWKQLGVTLGYLWESVDKRWFRPKVRFEDGAMKGQRETTYDVVGGPGRGSVLVCAVFNAENLAGPRAEVVVSDEPLPERVFNELWPRLFGRGGRMVMGFTPTLGTSEKLDYAWALVDDSAKPFAGQIHVPLTVDAVTPRGGLVEVPWATQAEIDQFEAGLSALEVEMRMGRSRNPVRGATYFGRVWGPHLVQRKGAAELDGWRLGIGGDHGNKPGAERFFLVAVDQRKRRAPAHVVAEYKSTSSKTEDHARGILAMLDAGASALGVPIGLGDVDQWVSDRAHDRSKFGPIQSNKRLRRELARLAGHDVGRRGWIDRLPGAMRKWWTPRKYLASHWEGFGVLHEMMAEKRLTIDPECRHLREDIEMWEGSKLDPHKDGLDGVRYIVIPMVEGTKH